jgi:hypothetical protein
MLKVLFAAVFVLWLVACSQSAGPAKGDGAGAASVPANGPLVTFTRVGGFAGFNDTLVVGRDGSLTLTDKTGAVRRGTAPAGEFKELKSLLHSGPFADAARAYGSPGGADRMTYTIDVADGPKVTTMDGVQQPEVVSKAVLMLSQMIGEVR